MKKLLLALLCLASFAAHADQKVSAMPVPPGAITGAELVMCTQSGASYKCTLQQVANLGPLLANDTVWGNTSGGTTNAAGVTTIPCAMFPALSGDLQVDLGTCAVQVNGSSAATFVVSNNLSVVGSATAGSYVHGVSVICQSGAATTSGSVTTEMNLGFCLVPAGTLGANDALEIVVTWQHPSTAVTKTYTIRFGSTLPTVGSAFSTGGTIMAQAATNSTLMAQSYTLIRNANSTTNQNVYGLGFTPFGAGSSTVYTPTQNTANIQYVSFDCTDASSNGTTETCGLAGYTVKAVLQ